MWQHVVSQHAATSPHNTQRHNFTECFNRDVILARLPEDSRRPKHVGAIIMCIFV